MIQTAALMAELAARATPGNWFIGGRTNSNNYWKAKPQIQCVLPSR